MRVKVSPVSDRLNILPLNLKSVGDGVLDVPKNT